MVVAKQSTQPFSEFDGTLGREWREFRSDDLVPQSLMVSFPVIMQNELRCRPVEACLPDQNHAVQLPSLGDYERQQKLLSEDRERQLTAQM